MGLVAAPRSANRPGVPAPPLLEFRDVPLDPAQNGRMCEFDPALAHHIHQIARTQFVTQIPPDTQDDDLLVEMAPFKQVRVGCRHSTPLCQCSRACRVCTRTLLSKQW